MRWRRPRRNSVGPPCSPTLMPQELCERRARCLRIMPSARCLWARMRDTASAVGRAVGVPGAAGGALVMNAGVGEGSEIKDVFVEADVLDLATGTVGSWGPERCNLRHRSSDLGSNHVVCRMTIQLTEDDPEAC